MHGDTLTNIPHHPILDLEPWIGQRQATFRFELVNGLTNERLGDIHPIRNANLSHDTNRTIKRQLTMDLGTVDTALVNPVTDRVLPYMVLSDGSEFPLGRYMFTDSSRQVFTSGRLGQMVLVDEMFQIDQQIEEGINGAGKTVMEVVQDVLDGLTVELTMESSTFTSTESWAIGATRGQILESLSVTGDYFSPWFDNENKMRFIRTFDPITKIPDFNWDHGDKVLRESIIETDNVLTAPNRFIVVSNFPDNPDIEVVGSADVPSTAPHSISNRGFVIPEVQTLQLANPLQAQAVAEGIAQRMNVFEQVGLTTPPDPRHDSYNVILWNGAMWLELAWSMRLSEGGIMSHLLRKAYA